LVRFIAAMHNERAAKYGAPHIKAIKGANVASGVTNCCAQTPQGAGNIVELTVKTDGKCGVGKCWHAIDNTTQ
jgi:hypothetical protein